MLKEPGIHSNTYQIIQNEPCSLDQTGRASAGLRQDGMLWWPQSLHIHWAILYDIIKNAQRLPVHDCAYSDEMLYCRTTICNLLSAISVPVYHILYQDLKGELCLMGWLEMSWSFWMLLEGDAPWFEMQQSIARRLWASHLADYFADNT